MGMFHIQMKRTNPKLQRWDTCDTVCFHRILLGTKVSWTYPDLPSTGLLGFSKFPTKRKGLTWFI